MPGNWLRPGLVTEVTQTVSCTSNQCMSNMERLKPQGIGWRWQKSPGNWSYANKGKSSAVSEVLPMVGSSPGQTLFYSGE